MGFTGADREQATAVPHDIVLARLQAIRAGTGPSLAGAIACGIYYAMTWGGPHRSVLMGLAIVAFAATALMATLPMRRVVGHRAAPAFFLGWSASLVALLATGAYLDGGPNSPLAALLFLPLPFAALSYPFRHLVYVAAMVVTAYVIVAVAVEGRFAPDSLLTVAGLALGGWLCAWLARIQDRHRDALTKLAVTDSLTGCLNRRGFEQRFEADLAFAMRELRPLTLVVLDLDGFKQINDVRGHHAGDLVLRHVGEALRRGVRKSDTVGRPGGDEFAVLLHASRDTADRVTARLATACAEFTSASFGAASYPEDGCDLDTLGRIADQRLYGEKTARPANLPIAAQNLSSAR